MNVSPLCIGLDAGGSKTELHARHLQDPTVRTLRGDAANLQRLGTARTAGVLAGLIRAACRQASDAPLLSVCAGVAGAGRPGDRQALAEELRRQLQPLDPPHMLVTDDGTIALEAAFEGGSGMIVIAGTGSLILAQTPQGTPLRAGGWGYLLGDEGSGYALGQRALQAVAAAHDGGPATSLRELLRTRCGIATPEDLIRRVYREGWALQEVAPLLLEAATAGDAAARRIVEEQAHELARRAAWLAAREITLTPRFALIGGLTNHPFYRQALTAALHAHLPGWKAQAPALPPVAGALRRALQAASSA